MVATRKVRLNAAIHISRKLLAAGLNEVDVARITGIDIKELPSQNL
jgi:hypothetical protein